MSNYKKYSEEIKNIIIRTGNINALPALKIPRTTALYWIKSSKKKIEFIKKSHKTSDEIKVEDLEKSLEKEKAKNVFLSEFLSKCENIKEIYKRESNKRIIVEQINHFNKWLSIESMCASLGIPSRQYFRYKVEVLGCEKIGLKKCKILAPNQLSFSEQEIIYNVVNDPKLAHLSIKGLQYHAFRSGLISCGYDTWRKYYKQFKRGLDQAKKKSKKYKVGIRAKKINEIWHMDITEFRLRDGQKIYVQVVMDNFSRKIINWRMSSFKNEVLSLETMSSAISKEIPDCVLTDGGGENIGHVLKRLYLGKNIKSIIAKKDVLFSNSMIESFFKLMKNRFINKYATYKKSKLYRLIHKTVTLFNCAPNGLFNGATPDEIYNGTVDVGELGYRLKLEIFQNKLMRPKKNQGCLSRNACPS